MNDGVEKFKGLCLFPTYPYKFRGAITCEENEIMKGNHGKRDRKKKKIIPLKSIFVFQGLSLFKYFRRRSL